ncbi:FecCD family ABC transporter permease [Thermopirellula anaerolimosa]
MKRADVLLVWVLLVGIAVPVVAPLIGPKLLSPTLLWSGEGLDARILRDIRIPRVLTAFTAGAVLALGGMAFQAMFRNPLATPYTLGIAGGASFAAALAIQLGLSASLFGVSSVSLAAFVGACGVILLVFGLTRLRADFSTETLLLAGVTLSFFFSSMILTLQYLSDPTRTFRMLRWMMGGLEGTAGYRDWLAVLIPALPAATALGAMRHEMNLLTLGEEWAIGRGVALARTKAMLLGLVGWMVASVVAVCGPIGFVGLIVPHICRLLAGPDHRRLFPVTLVFGGAFLVICDTAARTVLAPTEIPVGIVTSLLGGPFFLWLLVRRSPVSNVP